MSKVGEVRPSEMRTYIDKKSGREVVQLTQTGTNVHFYFTENSFNTGDKEIIYLHTDEHLSNTKAFMDLYSMNLETGESVRLTDFAQKFKTVRSFTKTKDGRFVLFIGDGDLYRWERATDEYLLLFRAPVGCPLSNPSISYDEKYVLCYANQGGPWREKVTNGNENYSGFQENLFRLKKGYIFVVRMDGSGGDLVFEDTHRLGHTQWASDTNEYFAFCHEGPWNMVHQRIWIFNTVTRHVEACFRQYEDDCVGHEFWTQDGLMFFDNRGKGHDGTITSDRTQLIATDEDAEGAEAWIGFADKECNILKKMDMPFYCNHYHCNGPHTLLVGDALDDILLIDISGEEATCEVLCEHNTSWRFQDTHCHPCFSWSDDQVLYASDRDAEGYPQLYIVKMK